jgi:ribosomal protein L19
MNVLDIVENSSSERSPGLSTWRHHKVHVKIKEGDKERIQVFEGVCIRNQARWQPYNLHRPQDFLRSRR